MSSYLDPVTKVLQKLLKFRSDEINKEYFSKTHGHLKELAQEESARGYVESVLWTLLWNSPYKPLVRTCDYVVRLYFNKLSGIEIDGDDVGEGFQNAFKTLKELDFAKMDANYANIVYEACQYILISEHLESRQKSHALGIIIKIGTTGDSNELGSEILQMMIDYFGQHMPLH